MATRMKKVEIIAGDFLRVQIFPVRNYHRGQRCGKFAASSAAQEKYNCKRRAMRIMDLLHTNFTDRDFAVRLSYDGESPDVSTAEKCIRKFLRRLKYAYQKKGCELKYIYCTEQGKNSGRVHHHLVVNACPGITDNPYFFRGIWRNGGLSGKCSYAYVAPLEFAIGEGVSFEDGGLVGLSKYMVFDKPKITDKQYNRSRNLIEPEVREIIGDITCRAVDKLVSTGDLTEISEEYSEYNICTIEAEVFDATDRDSPPMTGTFVTLYLCRKKMRFNCRQRRIK